MIHFNKIIKYDNPPLKVGITGGIGSGKTTVCKIFERLGIPVYYSDDEAKRLMVEDVELVGKIKHIFGAEAYLEDGSLNRRYISESAFTDKTKLTALNEAVHPAVAADGIRWNALHAGMPFTIKEAALIFESVSDRYLDKVITVFAPVEVRIERLLARDGSSREAIEARMRAQMPESEKIERSDFVIYNDGRSDLEGQVMAVYHSICGEAKFIIP